MNRRNRALVLLFTFMILGTVIAVQSKSILEHNQENISNEKKMEDLIRQLENENKKEKELNKAISNYEKEKEAYLNTVLEESNSSYLETLKEQLDLYRTMAGLTEVKGAGIRIRLEDALPAEVEDKNVLLIHDTDMLKILNELKKSGAQAISVNGERLTTISKLVCAGPTILINNGRYAPPYTILAIGDPDKMYSAVDTSERVLLMRRDGIRINIEKSSEIKIPKYNYSIDAQITSLEVLNK